MDPLFFPRRIEPKEVLVGQDLLAYQGSPGVRPPEGKSDFGS